MHTTCLFITIEGTFLLMGGGGGGGLMQYVPVYTFGSTLGYQTVLVIAVARDGPLSQDGSHCCFSI